MAKQPVVGLGDVSFDPSLQTDEVDHDFFDNPASLPEPESPPASSNVVRTMDSTLKIGFPLAPIRIVTESPPLCPDSNETFSTGTLLACLNNPPTELSVEVNGSHNSFRRNCSASCTVSSPKNERNKKSKRQPRIKLFDISDSSSDESAGSDGSDEELNNFMEKYYDLLDVEDTDNSDITEVSPMSSLNVSPLPAFVGEGSGAEDSNHSLDGSSNNKFPGSHISFRSISGTEFSSIGMEKSENACLPTIIPTIRQPLVINTGEEVSPNSFSGLFSESKDQNQNGDRSPSDSSCVSACGSTNNSCASSISFTVSPKRSCCSSSTSSCGSIGPKKSGRNFTFTPDQLKRIERENGILLKKILDVQRHNHHHHHLHHLHHHGSHRGSHKNTAYRNMQCAATIARQKQQRKIDHDNLMLMKRLQTAKPSREIGEAFKNKNA